MALPASVTRKILPSAVETRIAVFATVTKVGPCMPHTVDTSPIIKFSQDEDDKIS